jgi:hypothetical protein
MPLSLENTRVDPSDEDLNQQSLRLMLTADCALFARVASTRPRGHRSQLHVRVQNVSSDVRGLHATELPQTLDVELIRSPGGRLEALYREHGRMSTRSVCTSSHGRESCTCEHGHGYLLAHFETVPRGS